LAGIGAQVVCAARSVSAQPGGMPGTIHDTVAEITDAGGTAIAVRCDIGDAAEITHLVVATVTAFRTADSGFHAKPVNSFRFGAQTIRTKVNIMLPASAPLDVVDVTQAMYEPNAFIVPGFNPGMPTINKPPIGLTDQEILCVIAYLQTLGGTPTVTLQTKHRYNAGAAAPGAAAAPPAGGPAK